MSRHRDIRNMNIDAELDDDALSDGGDEVGNPEDQANLDAAFEQIRQAVGDEVILQLPERDVRGVLWDSYYDIEGTVQWCLEEYERKRVAAERKDGDFYNQNPSSEVWSRIPKIMQAQPEGGYLTVDDYEPKYRLSTIDEKTERTETQTLRHSMSSHTTSYGEWQNPNRSMDPNSIPPSPSPSAAQRLSQYDKPPSAPRSASASNEEQPRDSVTSIPPITIVAESVSTTSHGSNKPLPPKPSKLSMLASSRASSKTLSNVSERTQSSQSSGTTVTGSVKTFPHLRPSSVSEVVSSTAAPSFISHDFKNLPPRPRDSTVLSSVDTQASLAVAEALAAALKLEGIDNNDTSGAETPKARPASPTKVRSPSPTKRSVVSPPPSAKSPVPAASDTGSSKTATSAKTAKPLSKLALLAQQKVEGRGPKLPKTTTEYLTPIANGSSVTTAITTSYQSLYSLTDPTKSNVIPRLDLVPLQFSSSPSPSATPTSGKMSKLALKAKQRQERSPATTEIFEEEYTLATPPIFTDSIPQFHEGKRSSKRSSRTGTTGESRSSSRKKHVLPPSSLHNSTTAFPFDSPSPDDIVLKARKGTNLSRSSQAASAAGTGK
ncbi:hypothetical protein BKA70DRAFT_568527 [Coprinopsis sp. MPI-PUGE-AT-0042]|nr:hypothetical protein BKA70DRAFT_568527 [Coprinopsis sp. MPI-PUGE-AT-0042]